MTGLEREILNLSKLNDVEAIEAIIESRLAQDPSNCDMMLRYGILELVPPISDYYKSIESIKNVLSIRNKDAVATILLAYINHYYLGGIDEELLQEIRNAVSNNAELSSMLKYAESWYYEGKDKKMQEACLQESINICDSHVWNVFHLGKLYLEKDKEESEYLINKAMKNVVTLYSNNDIDYDLTSVNEFLNERIKGICLTKENYELIKEQIVTA